MKGPRIPPGFSKVAAVLKNSYHDFAHHNLRNPLNELLYIIASTKTTGVSHLHTYRRFRRAFPTFASMRAATEHQLAAALASGGLHNVKAAQISRILGEVERTFGRLSLSDLRKMSDDECERFMISLPGVGRKVARCVMMYSLDRNVFPIDTHCWRISTRLGWMRSSTNSSGPSPKDADRLQELIPHALRFSLHVNMVSLGRDKCIARDPRCPLCPLATLCPKCGVQDNPRD